MSKTRRSLIDIARATVRCTILSGLLGILSNAALAQIATSPAEDDPQRTQPVEPFEIIDNVYFVGARMHLPSYLFTTPVGHILIDTTYDEHVSEIVANIESLGFSIDDVKLLLATHAHHDHVGGHANMREISGAITLATAADADVIESGGKTDFRDRGLWAPSKVDRIIVDGEKVRLGDRVLTAHVTPGHTKGCTTWTTKVEEHGKQYDLALVCGLRVNSNEPLVGHPQFLDMPQQFAYSFARLKILPVDVFLGAHGYWFDVQTKHAKLMAGTDTNPFIDPDGYRLALTNWENAYLERLRQELTGEE